MYILYKTDIAYSSFSVEDCLLVTVRESGIVTLLDVHFLSYEDHPEAKEVKESGEEIPDANGDSKKTD